MDLLRILEEPGSVLLDTSADTPGRSLLFRSPVRTLSASRPNEVPELLRTLDRVLEEGWYAAGYLSYECGYGFEPDRFSEEAGIDYEQLVGYPLAWFGLYREPGVLDSEMVSASFAELASDLEPDQTSLGLTLNETVSDYEAKIHQVRKLIHDGDVYQVNFTARFQGVVDKSAPAMYAFMRRRQPVAFGAFIQLGSVQLLSASPEQFIEWKGREITARPMKGTAPRGSTPELDALLADWLQTDIKNRAENLMIVDLLRNDLSIVCEPGSVQVPSLFEVETYESVLQMTSSVTGRLKPARRSSELLAALFPCGSVTGAPKIRAMRRIMELESQPRGIYCGAIGHLTPGGGGSFSVAIRTLSLVDDSIVLGSGGGIVWDSDPSEEYRECLLKSHFLTSDSSKSAEQIQIIETMRWENGIPLLHHHLARLERTARILGYSFPITKILSRLEALDGELQKDRSYVIRLLLGAADGVHLESRPLENPLSRPYRLGLARGRVASENPFAQLKTTFRGLYDAGRKEAMDRALDEIVYLNERDELTEGTITNVFLEIDGKWVTPPLSCGVLPGIGRELEMASSREPRERILTAVDLMRAENVLLTNAVRGTVEATYVAEA